MAGACNGQCRHTPREQRLAQRLRTPEQVQRWLRALPYDHEPEGDSLKGLRGVLAQGRAHCIEAALSAAAILEHHGYPPLLLDLESSDGLDHVLFLYRGEHGFGTVGKSREPGLEGRKPVYRNVHTLVQGYAAPYIDDEHASIMGYAVLDLNDLPRRDWRWSARNLWYVERALIDLPHRPFSVNEAYRRHWMRRYKAFRARHPGREPTFYPNRALWA